MDNRQIDLSRYRIEKAKQCIESAKLLLDSGDWGGAVNRSYYAIFNSVRSVLALEGVDFSKHSGVISYFQKNYIKTGIFGKEYSKILTQAFSIRNDSDYADFNEVSEDTAANQIKDAEYFFAGMQNYIESRLLFS